MTLLSILLGLTIIYLLAERGYLKKKIKGELEFQKWSDAYTYEIKKNRENVLTKEQWSEVNQLDEATERKFNNEIQPPNLPTLHY